MQDKIRSSIQFFFGRIDVEASQEELVNCLTNAIKNLSCIEAKSDLDSEALINLKNSLRQILIHSAIINEYIDKVHHNGLGMSKNNIEIIH